jgi:hypothetical protein
MLSFCLLICAAQPMNTESIKIEALKKFGPSAEAPLGWGVNQVAALWRKEDGDLKAFVLENFIVDTDVRRTVFKRFEANLEQIDGHFLEIGRELKRPTELELGPMSPVDPMFAGIDLSAHVTEDLFDSKLAFVILLNFPLTTLDERLNQSASWTREQWAQARLASRFARRVPAQVQQAMTKASSQADLYIAEYNLWMHHVLSEKGDRLFPQGKRLISHWNLRDELKANYADKNGLDKQRTIIKLMERIVTQTIPAVVIDNPRVDWNPFSNSVMAAPQSNIEPDAPNKPALVSNKPEDNVRYQKLLANFNAQRKADPFSPVEKTVIERSFSSGAEMSEQRVVGLLKEILESPLVPQVAAQIERQLGRPLEASDLWFNGFSAKGTLDEAVLDAKLKAKYPTAEAFAKDIPRILMELKFSKERAQYLADRIKVDPARGAGHALQSGRRGDFPRLRTRVEKDGMNYKGYNIAVHELGHNVEQVFSLYNVDSTLLAGVPNTAFTEAIAFVFQARDLALLGMPKADAQAERLRVLNDFWMTWEIAGVALVDIAVWHWMYEHPNATAPQLKEAVVKLSQGVWNQYYAKILNQKDTPLLGIYSHMVSYPMYLFNYPLGHLIAFQIEEQVNKTGNVGPEIERMAKVGMVTPDAWMTLAAGAPVSAAPLLRATESALKSK